MCKRVFLHGEHKDVTHSSLLRLVNGLHLWYVVCVCVFAVLRCRCKIADVQKVAKACGHSKTGVRALVQAVLEPLVGMPKSKVRT